MERRTFLRNLGTGAATMAFAGVFPPSEHDTHESARRRSRGADIRTDVVVVGGTPAGIAAAVAAAREGSEVVLLESTRHVGGIVANGLTNADIGKRMAVGGIFYEYTRRILRHYRETYGADSTQVEACRDGYWTEPHVAEQVFVDMLAGEGENIRLLYRHRIDGVMREGARISAVRMHDLNAGNAEVVVRGDVFIDATYEGDLAARAGAPYRVGREGREEYGEPHAGVIYARFGHDEFLPGSTGAGDEAVQAYCFRMFVTDDPGNRIPIEKPSVYNPEDYKWLLSDIRGGSVQEVGDAIQLYPMPNNKYEINSAHPDPETGAPSESLDLAEENWDYPDATYEERERIFQRYWNHNLGLLWFLGNDPRIPEHFHEEMRRYGFCKDEFTDNDYHPRQMYVRQSRRIEGRYILTERDAELNDELNRTQVQPTAITIGEWAWDPHAHHKYDPRHPGVREGYLFLEHDPIQVPYEVLLPQKVEGLLVPVCCSASHIGYQTLRLEPVYMALGQAAGVAAHLTSRKNTRPHQIAQDELQMRLVERGAVVTYFDDVPFEHPSFAALQFTGARGLNAGYTATPAQPLNRGQGREKLQRILKHSDHGATLTAETGNGPLLGFELTRWLNDAGWHVPHEVSSPLLDRHLTVEQFSRLVYEAYTATHL